MPIVPINLTGTDVEEYGDSPTSSYERGKGSGQRVLKCDWNQRLAYRDLILPSPDMSGQFVNIQPAFSFPGDPNLIAKSVQIKPFGRIVSGPTVFPPVWEFALLTISYETMDYFQTSQQFQPNTPAGARGIGNKMAFVSHETNISGDFLSWPSSALQYGGNADPASSATGGQQRKIPEDAHAAIVIPSIEHKITWHYVPYPPWAAMRWLVGNVNAYWFAGCAPETLLFLGCNAKREMPSSGTQLYTLEYKFNEKNMNQLDPTNAFGWNHYLRVNGFNAGAFQIVDRKSPSGYTTLENVLLDSDSQIVVKSRESFPASVYPNPGFFLQIEDEIVSVSGSLATKTWTVDGHGKFGTAAVTHDDGTAVRSIIASDLFDGVDNKTRNWQTSNAPFPQVGQFFLQCENETVVVSRRFRSDPTKLYVLRGVRGTRPAAHAMAKCVKMANCPMFPLGDFNFLFRSGLEFS